MFNYIVTFFTGAKASSFEMLGQVNLAPWSIVIVFVTVFGLASIYVKALNKVKER